MSSVERGTIKENLFEFTPEFYMEAAINAFHGLRHYFHPTTCFSDIPGKLFWYVNQSQAPGKVDWQESAENACVCAPSLFPLSIKLTHAKVLFCRRMYHHTSSYSTIECSICFRYQLEAVARDLDNHTQTYQSLCDTLRLIAWCILGGPWKNTPAPHSYRLIRELAEKWRGSQFPPILRQGERPLA